VVSIGGKSYLIVEKNCPVLTEDDLRTGSYKKFKKMKEGPFLIVPEEEYPTLAKGKALRIISKLSESLFSELKLTNEYNSLQKIISQVGKKEVSPKLLEERNKLLYRLMLENTLSTWKRAFGIFPCLYALEDSYSLFSFLTEVLEKKGLYETFSLIVNQPVLHESLDPAKRQHAYILNEKYRLINLSKDENGRIVWVPNSFDSPYTFNKFLKKILEMENAPKEILKIVEKQEKILSEERRKIEEMETRLALRRG
jgi:hypothetical protein